MERAYLAGPMRGLGFFNFPAFDEAAAWGRANGWEIVSPAEIDRELGLDESKAPELPDWFTLEGAMKRDLHEVTGSDALWLLPGWESSEGSQKELTCAVTCGLDIYLYDEKYGESRLLQWNANPKHLVNVAESTEKRIVDPDTGGAKGQKLARFDLIPPDSLWALAEHFGRGAEKYGDRNWELGNRMSLNFAAAQRHLWQWWNGEDQDDEGFSHLIAVAWHALCVHHNLKTHPEKDDRPNAY